MFNKLRNEETAVTAVFLSRYQMFFICCHNLYYSWCFQFELMSQCVHLVASYNNKAYFKQCED